MAENAGGLDLDVCNITFMDNFTSSFKDNFARDKGGAILSHQHSNIMFIGHSTGTFSNNRAENGGALYIDDYSDGIFPKCIIPS